jgi:phosphoribosylformylglycinamidine (FGAM) synthase PurS component
VTENRAIVAIRLKVPDNTAFTALVALRRSGVEVARVERAEMWFLDDAGEPETLAQRVRADESIFNPHLHEVEVRNGSLPRAGEVWIAEASASDAPMRVTGVRKAKRAVSWSLLDSNDAPASRALLECACKSLLCNAAIEEAAFS